MFRNLKVLRELDRIIHSYNPKDSKTGPAVLFPKKGFGEESFLSHLKNQELLTGNFFSSKRFLDPPERIRFLIEDAYILRDDKNHLHLTAKGMRLARWGVIYYLYNNWVVREIIIASLAGVAGFLLGSN